MSYKVEFIVQVPEFGEVIVDGDMTEEQAYNEAMQLIQDLYPEATNIEVNYIENVH